MTDKPATFKEQDFKPAVYSYFIERRDTQEWHYIEYGFQEGINTAHPGEMTYENRWTKDPLKANRFATREMAEAVLFLNYELRQIGCDVTEHEFIDSSVEREMQRREVEFAKGFETWKNLNCYYDGLNHRFKTVSKYYLSETPYDTSELIDLYRESLEQQINKKP